MRYAAVKINYDLTISVTALNQERTEYEFIPPPCGWDWYYQLHRMWRSHSVLCGTK